MQTRAPSLLMKEALRDRTACCAGSDAVGSAVLLHTGMYLDRQSTLCGQQV